MVGTNTVAATGLVFGQDYGCFTDSNYNAFCWGGNANQQIAPAGVLPHCAFQNGMNFECADSPHQLTRPQANFGFLELAAGDNFSCSSFYPVGTPVHCWGKNDHGQLGDGTNNSRGTAAPVAQSLGALSLSAGTNHACLVADGANASQLYCWGSNAAGQLGNGNNNDANTPQRVIEP